MFVRVLAKLNLTISTQAPPPPAATPEDIAKIVKEFESELTGSMPAPRDQLTYEDVAEQYYGSEMDDQKVLQP
jgi:hypothetical protein